MKKTMNFIVIITLLLLALTACSSEDVSPTDQPVQEPDVVEPTEPLDKPECEDEGCSIDIEGIKWTLLFMGKSSPLPGSEITAEFDGTQITGTAGCNQYFGDFSLSGTDVSTGMVGSTEMACMEPEGVMEQETRFLQFLSEVVEADLSDDQLTLKKADGDSLVFVHWTETEPVSLDGTSWNLLYIGDAQVDGDTVSFSEYPVLQGTVITAEFLDSKIAGSAGCNTFNAGVEIDGSSLVVGPAMTTRMFCGEPEGLMDQEAKFLEILGGIERYNVDSEGYLVLTGANGSRLMFGPVIEQSDVDVDYPNIHGTNWKLVDLNSAVVVEGTEITAQFLEGNISGSSGCNTYNAGYKVDGYSLDIGMAISTLMFCDEPAGTMDQEQAYMAALAEVTMFRIDDGLLILGNTDEDMLVFEPIVE